MAQLRGLWRVGAICLAIALLASCASQDGLPRNYHNFNADNVPDAIPKVEPRSKSGNKSEYVVLGKRYTVLKSAECYHEKGIASWYGTKFHAKLTSSGEPYDMFAMTAANKELPLPTYVRVHNLENGKTIIVKVNDRGPFHENRIIDLSFAAAKKIGMMGKGTALVELTAIDPRHPNQTCGQTVPTLSIPIKPHIYLQIGAFSQKQTAESLRENVAKLTNVPTMVYQQDRDGKSLYKVQIGPINDVDTTDSLTSKLEAKGFGHAYAVVR